MITVRVTKPGDGLELRASGHAGYAPRGRDVVCAGVSALLYGFVAYLEELAPIATAGAQGFCGDGSLWEASDGDGLLWVRTHGMGGRDTDGFAAVEAGLRLIARAYPDCVTLEIHTETGDCTSV